MTDSSNPQKLLVNSFASMESSSTFRKLYWKSLDFAGRIEDFAGIFCDIPQNAGIWQNKLTTYI
jgi:hypothetical protein